MPTLTEKILKHHLVKGEMIKGKQIGIKIDQTLTQDATGTMAYLQLEALKITRVKTELSVSYIDHNTLQSGFENADDHKYLQLVAQKYGIKFSRAGNGICHQVHLERFSAPGKTLLGSDSHTPTSGAMAMIAIGAGGLDVACAMAGREFYLKSPEVVKVELLHRLKNGVSAKDIILEVLRLLGVKGGVGKVIEYAGEGVKTLTVPERSTITNMGAELGATTSIFPSDEITLAFLKAQGREEVFVEISADSDAVYDQVYTVDLAKLQPLAACPHSPDNIKTIEQLKGKKIDQVCIGSCTNSSYADLMKVANILKGKVVNEQVSLTISPGSRQVYEMLARSGALQDLISSGARILESVCGPCIGMGQSPSTDAVSLRTFNRNFFGRSGTKSANIYLVSPETAAYSALRGVISNPVEAKVEKVDFLREELIIDDRMIIEEFTPNIEVVRGPNIKPLPKNIELEDVINKKVILKVEDNITTDHIMPAGAKVLPYRSNIEKISEFVFYQVDANFSENCQRENGGIIVGGENYGQGSSREHAALAPMYLGIKAVIVNSFARIHRQNLINFGILPLVFVNKSDYNKITQGDNLEIVTKNCLLEGKTLLAKNITKNQEYQVEHNLSTQDIDIVKKGGLLNYLS